MSRFLVTSKTVPIDTGATSSAGVQNGNKGVDQDKISMMREEGETK